MSDMQMPGAPPASMPGRKPTYQGTMQQQRSIFNPADVGRDVAEGRLDINKTTIRQYFDRTGVDVDGPLSQLIPWAQKQAQNATPMGKVQGMAQGAPQAGMPSGMPGAAPRPAAPQAATGGLSELMKQVG